MNKNIEINLNPLTDGFVDGFVKRNAVSADRHALIIATTRTEKMEIILNRQG